MPLKSFNLFRCALAVAVVAICLGGVAIAQPPVPLDAAGRAADWWFVFKGNAQKFPGCKTDAARKCQFGGSKIQGKPWGTQYGFAKAGDTVLAEGPDCLGDSPGDPLSRTFAEIYNGAAHYVIWNDQFHNDPQPDRNVPWGHSKGFIAWDRNGDGFVVQGTTPGWPIAGRPNLDKGKGGNTLGCTFGDDVEYSQDFFAVRLSKADLLIVIEAMGVASVVTDPNDLQLVDTGVTPEAIRNQSKPANVSDAEWEVANKVAMLNVVSKAATVYKAALSVRSGVITVIAKPPAVVAPPWQIVSAELGAIDLRVANWSGPAPSIGSKTSSPMITCWDKSLPAHYGTVEIAATGRLFGQVVGLDAPGAADVGTDASGQPLHLEGPDHNHAKFAISKTGNISIFGDMNQQGLASYVKDQSECGVHQDARGGMFFVLDDANMHKVLASVFDDGFTLPFKDVTTAPRKK